MAIWWIGIGVAFIGILLVGGYIFEVGKSATVKRVEWLERAKRAMGGKS
jgi:hypothetical protein